MPDKYIIRSNVPILDEHVIRDEDGNPIAKIDEKRLHHIAERNNKRIVETGDWIPIVVGHTKGEPGDYVPEEEQPEIVGYAGNLTVGKFKRTGRKALHATFKFFKDKVDKIRKYPRRSIELWLTDWKIDPISLLGATTPERDLGLLQLSEGGRKRYRRVLKFERSEKPMDHEAIVKAVLEAIKQTDVWKFMEQMMKEGEQEPEEPGLEGEGLDDLDGEVDDADLNPEDEGEGLDDGEGGREPAVGKPEEEGQEPVRYSAMGGGCSAPSGSNTFTQGDFSGNGMKHKKNLAPAKHPRGRQQYQRTPARVTAEVDDAPADVRQLRVKLSRYERAVGGLQAAYNDLRIRFQRSEREKDLMALEGQGYELDRDEELDRLAGLDDDEYAYNLNLIRKRYSRAPVGEPRFDLDEARTGNPTPRLGGRDRDQALQVANYASRKGISYAEALEELEGA